MKDVPRTLVAGKESDRHRAAIRAAITRDANTGRDKGRKVAMPEFAFLKTGGKDGRESKRERK